MGNVRQGYNQTDLKDAGSEVIKIIYNILRSEINAPFLGKVVAVNGNKVDVTTLDTPLFSGIPMQPVIYYDMLVGMLSGKRAAVNMPISIGDIGLCIVTDCDITNYAKTGQGGVPASYRRFSKMDSVFIPLSMFLQKPITEIFSFNYFNKSGANTFKVEIQNNNTIDVKAGNSGDKLSIGLTDDGNLTIKITQNTIEVTSEGINIKDKSNNNIVLNNEGINIKDSGGNVIKLSASGVSINNGALDIMK